MFVYEVDYLLSFRCTQCLLNNYIHDEQDFVYIAVNINSCFFQSNIHEKTMKNLKYDLE
jgi:hypothetical protein